MNKNRKFNLAKLLTDNRIEFQETESGWLQMACPFCYKGDGKFGLGWSGKVFHCFRCGKLDRLDVVSVLLGKSLPQTMQVLFQYEGRMEPLPDHFNELQRKPANTATIKMPHGTTDMSGQQRKYLKSRNFDPLLLEKKWCLKGTGPTGPFAHRIIIPIFQEEKFVCYQGRDTTGKASAKYKSCPDEKAIIPIKNCLYGIDNVSGTSVVVTEGPTKVWRLGDGSVATFGAVATDAQIKQLTKFKQIFVLFDEDETGVKNAESLARKLTILGTKSAIITVGTKDVAELSDDDAATLMNDLLKQTFDLHKQTRRPNDIQN
jgi:DNA primase